MKFCMDSIFLFPKGLLKAELAIKHCLFEYLTPSTLNWETHYIYRRDEHSLVNLLSAV